QARINVELAAFIGDLPERMARAHLVIGRSGASTIAELTVLGRPVILVPLPSAIDADQKHNAMVMEAAGGAWIAEQATLSPHSLGTRITDLLTGPTTLAHAAAAARSLGRPRAVEKLADLAEMLSGKNILEQLR
ncbi:MAG: UDP-N-acetylglucosamine--N-acetylmuramyl-(pentapeptide) pyrophosphoryl-undecaprenol N-acetylglucosamine transferase, partial [Candidatus Devosia euplotis]|nr:UDP-N-acetylglucosamine--N-acetylmuramyl-(pentapeptide) pyrophosphoryl-undecaprenol N-acetylglucosamine transferase [Candidatus Devosia euplotis]